MPKQYYFLEIDGAGGGGGAPAGGAPAVDGGTPGGAPAGTSAGGTPSAMPNPFAPKMTEGGAQPSVNPVIPEEYKFNLPEGVTMSDELKGKFTEIAKGAKLTQEQADSLLKMHTDSVMEINGRAAEMANGWLEESHKLGLDTEQNLGLVNETLKMFGTEELRNVLVESGLACHPEVLTFLQRIGGLIHEDKPTSGGNVGSSAQINYFPNSKY